MNHLQTYEDFSNNTMPWVLGLVGLYVAGLFVGPVYMSDKPAYSGPRMKQVLTVWNLGLCLYSGLLVYNIGPAYLKIIKDHGLHDAVCGRTWQEEPNIAHWTASFVFSKIPELGDTVFLVINKKPVNFLHGFHHATVVLYCWHAMATVATTGAFFALMNGFVHTIMYGYYAKPCGLIAKSITSLQIAQMFLGVFVNVYAWYLGPDGCPGVSPTNVQYALSMYAAYAYLFCDYAYKRYYGNRF